MSLCESFPPIVDEYSRVLILGSMPGPEALRRREYYGFPGNHFWTIIPGLFGLTRPESYEHRVALLREKRIALWDVVAACVRPTALDADIRNATLNPIPRLLADHPEIRAVFLNGRTAEKLFRRAFGAGVGLPLHYLPSTSPAMASTPLSDKARAWAAVLRYLDPAPAELAS